LVRTFYGINPEKKGCSNWFACYRDAAGVRRQESTGTSDRSEAQTTADDFERATQGLILLNPAFGMKPVKPAEAELLVKGDGSSHSRVSR
jgi:hypothetical protein